MSTNQIVSIIYPVLYAFILALCTYIGKEVLKLVPLAVEWAVLKIGKAKYEKMMATGKDCWHIVDEKFRLSQLIGDTVDAKIKEFESLICRKIPGITPEEIEYVRQAIAGEINKDKSVIINEVTDPPVQEVKIEPVIKYFTSDGKEQQPVTTAATTEATVV